MSKISVVINTINEEKNLPSALKSVKGWADEIVVVDMYSDDETVNISKKAGAKVYDHKKTGYVEPARNYAISKASGDWILVLDADEKISKGLQQKLLSIAKNPEADYYRIPRKNYIFGKWIKHSRWWPDYNIRFFKKGHVSWNEVIHSVPMTQGKGLDMDPTERNAIIHYHYESIEQYIERLNRYTTQHAKNKVNEGYRFVWTDLIKRPSSEFLSRFFQGEGYKDGIHGLALSGLQAFSEFVTYLKIWQSGEFAEGKLDLQEVTDELKEAESDLNYWKAEVLIREIGGLKNRIKRKLKIS